MDPIDRLAMTPRTQQEAHLLQPWAPDPLPPVHLFCYGAALGMAAFLFAVRAFL